MSIFRVLLAVCISFFLVSASASAGSEIWTDAQDKTYHAKGKSVKQPAHRYLRADISKLKKLMYAVPLEHAAAPESFIDLPMPGGEMHTFVIEESPIMSPGLSAKFPAFKTYNVHSKDESVMSGRLDMMPTGFHAYLTTDRGVVMIDPDPDAVDYYRSFYKNEYFADKPRQFSCGVKAVSQVLLPEDIVDTRLKTAARSSNELLTYRLAVAATIEYSQAVAAGDIANTQAAIATAINRVNFIFERDLAISLQLVVDNGLISTNTNDFANADPLLLLEQSKAYIDSAIGVTSYDIGHVFSTGAGGLASLGVVCELDRKAEGVTGIANPVGDAFYIDYVAHEIGHQFEANHSFNGTTKDCGGDNRFGLTAFEPGSGSTIMGYAGICGAENIQTTADSPTAFGASDDTFHAGSIDEIVAFTRSAAGNCGVPTTNGNTAPDVNVGLGYTIPGRTPFELRGSATDPDPDTLTYQWDEMDTGAETNEFTYGTDLGTNPLFRSFSPSSNPVRTLPQLQTILSGIDDKAEHLPTTDRVLDFRLTVRDQNRGVNEANMRVTVDKDSGPFKVLSAATAVTLDVMQSQVLEWDAACTHVAPVSCANVDILLSTDSGATFPTTLLAATPNDGVVTVNFPAINSNTALVKIACTGNIFFDVNDSLISLAQGSGIALTDTGVGGTGGVCSPPSSGGSSSLNLWFLAVLLLCRSLVRRAAAY